MLCRPADGGPEYPWRVRVCGLTAPWSGERGTGFLSGTAASRGQCYEKVTAETPKCLVFVIYEVPASEQGRKAGTTVLIGVGAG